VIGLTNGIRIRKKFLFKYYFVIVNPNTKIQLQWYIHTNLEIVIMGIS